MKKQVQEDIAWFISPLPKFTKPVIIDFTWIEGDKRRDLDNICYAKKFILDALVKQGVLVDDGQRFVVELSDKFSHDKFYAVKVYIEEVQ